MPTINSSGSLALPDLLEAWTLGWTRTRGTSPPVARDGGQYVEVGLPEHRARYVFAAASEDFRRVARDIAEPWIMLKVGAPDAEAVDGLPSRWALQAPGFLMDMPIATSLSPSPPEGYRLAILREGLMTVARIISASGETAASGRAALADQVVVFDQIVTHEDHRRRGLGRVVMGALQDACRRDGGARGVLVATPDGRALYESLGWTTRAPIATLMIPGP
jgi:GNAT superfamily N-acetyltransferase